MDKTVCKKFCSLCAPDEKSFKCGSVAYLNEHLTKREIRAAARAASSDFDLSFDSTIEKRVCRKCKLYAGECEYRGGMTDKPCGGYPVIEHLLKQIH